MCGIGKTMVTVDCQAVAGPTDAPLTTAAPCEDKWSNCADLATTSCYKVSLVSHVLSLYIIHLHTSLGLNYLTTITDLGC